MLGGHALLDRLTWGRLDAVEVAGSLEARDGEVEGLLGRLVTGREGRLASATELPHFLLRDGPAVPLRRLVLLEDRGLSRRELLLAHASGDLITEMLLRAMTGHARRLRFLEMRLRHQPMA